MSTDETDERTLVEALAMGDIREVVNRVVGSPEGLQSQVIQGTGGTFFLRVLSAGLAFITSIVLARVLGAEDYGSYAYALSWVSILVIPAMMGGRQLLTREVSRYRAHEDWRALRGLLRRSNQTVLAASLSLALLGGLLTELVGAGLEPQTQTALWVSALLLPPFAFVRIRQSILRGLGHVVKAQIPQKVILPGGFLALVGLGYFYGGLSAPVAVGMRALAAVIGLLVVSMLLRKHLPEPASEETPVYRSREWIASALPMLLIAGANVVNHRVSVIMLGSLVDAEAAGVFDAARRGVGVVAFALAAVNMPLSPVIARLHSQGRKERMQRVVTNAARIALISSLPVGLGLILFRDPFLLLFGEEFRSGTTALTILCIGQLMNAGLGSVVQIMNMTGNEIYVATVMGGAAVLSIVLNAVLIPTWGLEGAALATAGSIAAWNVTLSALIYHKIGIDSTAVSSVQKL